MIGTQGFGSVFVKIFDLNGNDVTPLGISRFTYVHSENTDDYSEIVIENKDIHMADQKAFQEGKPIILLWGYLQGETRKQKVWLGEVTCFYEKTVQLRLMAFDKASYLKNNSSNEVHQDINLETLAKKVAEKNGLNYKGVNYDEASGEASLLEATESGQTKPTQLNTQGFYSTGRDHTAIPKSHLFKTHLEIPQANKSDRKVLDDVASKESGGPWVIEGRDDDLIVKKRNFNQKPLRTYNYREEDGQLLSFHPETKNRTKKKKSVEQTILKWDEDTKTLKRVKVNELTDNSTRLGGNSVDINPTQDLKVLSPDTKGLSDSTGVDEKGNIKNDEGKVGETSGVSTDGKQEYFVNSEGDNDARVKDTAVKIVTSGEILTRNYNETNPQGYYNTPTDNTAIVRVEGQFLTPKNEDVTSTPSKTSTSPTDSDAADEANNMRKDEALKKNPATATVVGWPQLQSGKLITITNVARIHSGNYYITKATHEIDYSSGYICTLEMVRNAQDDISDYQNKTKVGLKDIDKDLNNVINHNRPDSKTLKDIPKEKVK